MRADLLRCYITRVTLHMQGNSNTFRVVLATNGTKSFAVFIYSVLEWYQVNLRLGSASGSGSGSGGNGTASSESNPLPARYVDLVHQKIIDAVMISSLPCSAQAGFNSGDGVDFYVLPNSMDGEILTLSNTSYVNMSGVWIFQVDESVTVGGNL